VTIVYLDTSALVKQYVAEAGSAWVKSFLADDQTPTVFTLRLSAVETACAFSRRQREGVLSPADYDRALTASEYDLAYRYNFIEVTPDVVDAARLLARRHPLRAYDAMHLASAWLANRELTNAGNPPLTFISADDRLLAIAQAEDLLTDNPNRHP
jgi:predicted nucleic acid-binding protein